MLSKPARENGIASPDSQPTRREGAASGFSVLALSPDCEDHASLASVSSSFGWAFQSAYVVRQALQIMQSAAVALVICERELPDGDWKAVLDEMQQWPYTPLMIVTSRLADETLWAEVLNLGGYDVLLKPFEQRELIWSVTSAFHHWEVQTRCQSPSQPSTLRTD